MLVAYVTADEVNQYVALQMADIRGVALHSFCFKGPRPDCRYDAVLYDLDSLSSERRQEFVAELLSIPLPCPAAVHSRNLEERQVEALRLFGVTVFRCAIVSDRRSPRWHVGHSGSPSRSRGSPREMLATKVA